MNSTGDGDLQRLAELIRARNATEVEITHIIDRPAQIGHIGEYIASRVFDIVLERSAVNPGSDGRFRSGPLAGKSVNVKMYGKREALLDIRPEYLPDYFLVLTGPKSTVMDSKGRPRPWVVNDVFLFEAQPLIDRLRDRGVKLGVATSVREVEWKAARRLLMHPADGLHRDPEPHLVVVRGELGAEPKGQRVSSLPPDPAL